MEAVTNTVRHAGAGTCAVLVEERDGLRVTVRDDGVGLPARPPGVGLSSMRDRAEELGGTCDVTFEEGVGTTVVAVLPVWRRGVAG
jgi:signal transduction histidine kinase